MQMKLKGNFTQIPNKIIEALIKSRLGGTEKDVIFTVCRDTYGWGREFAQIAYGGFAKQTGLSRPYCVRVVKNLRLKRIIIGINSVTKNSPHLYRINEDIKEWRVEFRGGSPGVTSNQQDTKPSDLEETSSGDPRGNQETNKEKKERVEKIKKQIRRQHAFLRNG